METNNFTVNGEIRHKLKRQHTLYFNNETWEKLKLIAEEKGLSVSELLLKFVEWGEIGYRLIKREKEFLYIEKEIKKD